MHTSEGKSSETESEGDGEGEHIFMMYVSLPIESS